MENSASSGGSTVTPSSRVDLNQFCMCGVPCKIQTSWTEKNPGRRFFGCGNYGMLHHCQYFSWIDQATCERSTKVMNGLLNEKSEVDYGSRRT
ncbi:Zinc finger, GRF-type [Sesbania bispinosa]|nr:Zinc finger, GRF-type [Sesbania bispinosa]